MAQCVQSTMHHHETQHNSGSIYNMRCATYCSLVLGHAMTIAHRFTSTPAAELQFVASA